MTVTTVTTYALLAAAAYRTARNELNWLGAAQDSGWTLSRADFDASTGVEYSVFRRANSNEYVIAFTGTDDARQRGERPLPWRPLLECCRCEGGTTPAWPRALSIVRPVGLGRRKWHGDLLPAAGASGPHLAVRMTQCWRARWSCGHEGPGRIRRPRAPPLPEGIV